MLCTVVFHLKRYLHFVLLHQTTWGTLIICSHPGTRLSCSFLQLQHCPAPHKKKIKVTSMISKMNCSKREHWHFISPTKWLGKVRTHVCLWVGCVCEYLCVCVCAYLCVCMRLCVCLCVQTEKRPCECLSLELCVQTKKRPVYLYSRWWSEKLISQHHQQPHTCTSCREDDRLPSQHWETDRVRGQQDDRQAYSLNVNVIAVHRKITVSPF